MKPLVVATLVVGLSVWGCSSSGDRNSTGTGGTHASGGASETSTDSGGAGSGGVSSGGVSSGGTTSTWTALGGTGGASTATTTVVVASCEPNCDTNIAAGEFSFFTLSMDFVLSKKPCDSANTTAGGLTCYGGFGGDLRNGTTHGLDGADALCTEAAQKANTGDKHRWRAFLSVANYQGAIVHAIDRIGTGPWYSSPSKVLADSSYATDGLLMALTKTDLIVNANLGNMRPNGATVGVYTNMAGAWPFNQCLLDENGLCPLAYGDDHDVLTGSDPSGKLINGGGESNCDDWTNSAKAYGAPQIGHSWPRALISSVDVGSMDASHWCSTTGHTGIGCGAIINVTDTNYLQDGLKYGGGVGSTGGYGAIYCFAYSVP